MLETFLLSSKSKVDELADIKELNLLDFLIKDQHPKIKEKVMDLIFKTKNKDKYLHVKTQFVEAERRIIVLFNDLTKMKHIE